MTKFPLVCKQYLDEKIFQTLHDFVQLNYDQIMVVACGITQKIKQHATPVVSYWMCKQ